MSAYSPPTYIFSMAESVSDIAAKNHVVLLNPSTSVKPILFGGFFASFTSVGVSTFMAPMRGYRCSDVSGGTLHDVAETCKFDTALPNPVARLYTANPSVTLGAALLNSPLGIDKRSSAVHQIESPVPFLVRPGEGIVLRQGAVGLDLYWNLSVLWREL